MKHQQQQSDTFLFGATLGLLFCLQLLPSCSLLLLYVDYSSSQDLYVVVVAVDLERVAQRPAGCLARAVSRRGFSAWWYFAEVGQPIAPGIIV